MVESPRPVDADVCHAVVELDRTIDGSPRVRLAHQAREQLTTVHFVIIHRTIYVPRVDECEAR